MSAKNEGHIIVASPIVIVVAIMEEEAALSYDDALVQLDLLRDRGHADSTTRLYRRRVDEYIDFCRENNLSEGIVTTTDVKFYLRREWKDFIKRNGYIMSVSVCFLRVHALSQACYPSRFCCRKLYDPQFVFVCTTAGLQRHRQCSAVPAFVAARFSERSPRQK